MRARRLRALLPALLVIGAVAAAAIVSTWPMAVSTMWDVPRHQDPLFSVWRLYQWTRNLFHPSAGLTGGNIFYPAPDVLFYSDAILVPALLAAPWIQAGVPPILAYDVLVWLAFLSAGLGMYLFARDLTGHRGGAIVAAVIYTGAPYRIEHLMHLELLWTCWMPLTLWAVRRVMAGERGGARWLGAGLIGQFLCCVYYGLFLMTVLPIIAGTAWLVGSRRLSRQLVVGLAVPLAATVVVVWVYSLPYQRVRETVGDRDTAEIESYGASVENYLATPSGNWLWGWTADPLGGREKRLSPGLAAWVLAAPALLPPFQPWTVGLVAGTAFALDASRGLDGVVYPVLLDVLSPYAGLRVPARFAVIVLTAVAALAAIGIKRIDDELGGRPLVGAAIATLAVAVLLVEYTSVTTMRHMPDDVPPVYAWLAAQPPTVVAHMPMPRSNALPGDEADYQYFAQYHHHVLVNGNSGNYPPDYIRLLDRIRNFPDTRAIEALRGAGVRILVLHAQHLPRGRYEQAVLRLRELPGVEEIGELFDEAGRARVYRLSPAPAVTPPPGSARKRAEDFPPLQVKASGF